MPFSESGHGDFGRESGKLRGQLSEREIQILDQLTTADIQKARSLYSENLLKAKDNIVAVRTDDLLYFLESIHKGYIPVGPSPIRSKHTEEGAFFVSLNPESPQITQRHPDLIRDDTDTKLGEVINLNYEVYGQIGKTQAVYRNLIAPYVPIKDLKELANKFNSRYQLTYRGPDILEGYFYEMATHELDNIQKDCFAKRLTKPALFALGQYLKNKGVNTAPLAEFLANMGNRGSICIAFNNELITRYQVNAEAIEDANEMVIHVPDGKLSLETVHGFESLGDFEDQILKKLGIAEQ